MPRRDGTGPEGAGPMTGRGFGLCRDSNSVRYGSGLRLGLGRCGGGRGFGRNIAPIRETSITQKELLQEQRNVLKNRLDAIDKQLNDM